MRTVINAIIEKEIWKLKYALIRNSKSLLHEISKGVRNHRMGRTCDKIDQLFLVFCVVYIQNPIAEL